MKKIIFLIISVSTLKVYGHCPIALEIKDKTFCTEVNWLKSESKVNGNLKEELESSPQLNLDCNNPNKKRLFSKAQFQFWEKGDSTHKPVEIDRLNIFPYMMMINGEHHATTYNFTYNRSTQTYTLNEMNFMAMPGCWSLNWSLEEGENIHNSQLLTQIRSFANLNPEQNHNVEQNCQQWGPKKSP